MSFVSQFPEELSEYIFCMLPLQDICNATQCCKRWRQRCNSENTWKRFCTQRGWIKFSRGCLDLMKLPSSEDVLVHRTNVSGTSPKYKPDAEECQILVELPYWKQLFIRAVHLQENWFTGRYNVLPTLRGHENRVSALDSNGNMLVSGSSDCVLIWDLESLSVKYRISGHNDTINDIQLTGFRVVTTCADGAVRVFNTISGRAMYSYQARCAAEHVRITLDDLIVCSYADKALRVWSIKEKILKHTMRGHSDDVECLTVRDELCISGSWDNKVILWDVVQGTMIYALQGHTDAVMCCKFDGDHILSASGDGTVRIWNINTAECIQSLDEDTSELYCLAYNGSVIAAAGSGSVITLWSKLDYMLLHHLRQHLGVVRSLKFNGKRLVSGGDRKIICIWNSENGNLLNVVHRNPDLLHLMWVNETKIITASPNAPGSMTVLSYW